MCLLKIAKSKALKQRWGKNKIARMPEPKQIILHKSKTVIKSDRGGGGLYVKVRSLKYGTVSGLRNDGINIRAKRGSPVFAAESGVVAYAGNELRGFGNLLLIKHEGGWITAYAHNEKLLVKRGETLKRGQKIATVGSSGNVSTPQLHFELRLGRSAKNPSNFIKHKLSRPITHRNKYFSSNSRFFLIVNSFS